MGHLCARSGTEAWMSELSYSCAYAWSRGFLVGAAEGQVGGIGEAKQTDRAIGERVRRARKVRGLSQSQLGDALGVTFQQIQKYERGANRISSSALLRIAEALEVPPPELLGLGETQPSDIDWNLLSAEGSDELLRHYRQISSPVLRRAVVDLARKLASA